MDPDDWVSMTFDPKLQVSVKELQQALLGNRRLTAEALEELLLLRERVYDDGR